MSIFCLFFCFLKNDFSPLSQFASYDKLNAETSGQSSGHIRVTVNNTGAYRKLSVEVVPGIRGEEYFRAHKLIEKYRFDRMKLRTHEFRVIRGMVEHLMKCLHRKQNCFLKKIRLRYFYAR